MPGSLFEIDRTLDANPPFFTVWALITDEKGEPVTSYVPQFPQIVPINGEENWGDGLSWAKAEAIFIEAMRKPEDE